MQRVVHDDNARVVDGRVKDVTFDQFDCQAWNLFIQHVASCCEHGFAVVDANESQTLNRTYRGKDNPTNVLSFPAQITIPEGPVLLGDIAICWPVVVREAKEQSKSIEHHLAHMVIHGCFHLLGYDHDNDQDAEAMEAKEIGILNNLGYPNPYLSQELKDT